jgi:hypothetical protein
MHPLQIQALVYEVEVANLIELAHQVLVVENMSSRVVTAGPLVRDFVVRSDVIRGETDVEHIVRLKGDRLDVLDIATEDGGDAVHPAVGDVEARIVTRPVLENLGRVAVDEGTPGFSSKARVISARRPRRGMSSWSSSTRRAPRDSAQARCFAAPTPLMESSMRIRSRGSSRAGRQRAPEFRRTTHSQSSNVCDSRLLKHSSRNRGWWVTVKTLTRGGGFIAMSDAKMSYKKSTARVGVVPMVPAR